MANLSRNKSDSRTLDARKLGYPARSVFKLMEIERKFAILRNSKKVLDVGAAPGSWSLYVSREILKGAGLLVSVDLNPLSLSPMPSNVVEMTGDAFSDEIQSKFAEYAPFGALISDAAPHTTGNRLTDCSRSMDIANGVLALCPKNLRKGGAMIVKVFQGEGISLLTTKAKSSFRTVSMFKPEASRSDSFEIYMICRGYNADLPI